MLQNLLSGSAATSFPIRLALDLIFAGLIIRLTYYRYYRRTDLFLTFFSFNLVIFMIAWLMTSVEISLGAAFGLFAVFSMLRYRTEGISTPDMTYLFMVIALGLMMAIGGGGIIELALIGATLAGFTELLEHGLFARREIAQTVHYDNVELIAQPLRSELIADLRQRTGLDVHRVDVQEIDFLRDAARIKIYYYEHKGRAA